MKKLYSVTSISTTVILFLILFSTTASAATLNVGPKEKYHTIQSAVNAAHNDDTIKVAYGTYKETVNVNKMVTILGTNYPKVDGFYYPLPGGSGGAVNGFSFQMYGISGDFNAGPSLIRNNYFYNCGIGLSGSIASSTIVNNQIIGGIIEFFDTSLETITGNTISNSKCGIYLEETRGIPTVTKNTFKNNKYAIYFYPYDSDPGKLTTFTGNKYINNRVNIGWGTKPI